VVRIDAGGNARLYTPYHPNLITDLKAAVPWRFRAWNKERGCWVVLEPFGDTALRVVNRYYDVELIDRRLSSSPPSRAPPSYGTLDDALTAVKGFVTPAMWKSVYKLLARTFHPDVGGSNELMKSLNRANDNRRPRRRS
jgi:hypothetical protein